MLMRTNDLFKKGYYFRNTKNALICMISLAQLKYLICFFFGQCPARTLRITVYFGTMCLMPLCLVGQSVSYYCVYFGTMCPLPLRPLWDIVSIIITCRNLGQCVLAYKVCFETICSRQNIWMFDSILLLLVIGCYYWIILISLSLFLMLIIGLMSS